ncbi:MAG TPA: tyrosine-type recombinase/integrase, partial [Planctomycetaceae bacterium]|nr:tyrosine-type recombinase/integrase [Planctomycetaceae bacterium]
RKVWVARWREDVLCEDGKVGRTLRSVVLGSVADLPTRRDAQVRLDEELRAVNQGTVRPESSMLFGTFAEEQWKTLVLPTLKLSTQHGYKTVLAKHLLPYWRDWRLRDIGRQDVQQWVADRFRQKLGWQTVRNSWTLLSGILETAVEYGYLSMNPARGVKFPEKELKEAPVLFTAEDFMKLLEQLDEPYRTMARLIALTGLRIGELLAVRWRCLDLEIGTLSVRESVYEGKFQSPKTRKSRRTMPLGPQIIVWLREHRLRAKRTESDDLVFGNRKGQPLRESKLLRNVLQPAAERAGLGRVTWHQFRHIHSSLLNDLRVPVKIAQEQLGHSSISTTLNIYTHVVDASHRKAIEALERELFPSVPKLPDGPKPANSASRDFRVA